MALRTAAAFAAAALALLVAATLARAVARRRGWQWPRRSGGVLLVLTVPVAFVAAFAVTERAVVVGLAAIALAFFGLVRDRAGFPRWLTPLVVTAAAVAATTTDLRFAAGGVDWVDVGWTVLWLVAVTTCVAGLGNADGLVPGVAGASTVGVVLVAAFAQQGLGSTVPAALLGGLVAFLAFNVPPASLSIGSAGSLFTGFVLAACTLWAQPAIVRPQSLLVSVLVVAVPLLDGLVVVVGRLRRRHPLMVRARDHLAHRLVGSGMRAGRAVLFLVVAQVVLSLVAVPLARGVLAPGIAAVVAAVVLATVFWASMRARLRGQETGFGWRVVLLVFGFGLFVVVASIPAGIAAFASRNDIVDGRKAAAAALRAARQGRSDEAAALFATAEREFSSAYDRLASPVTAPSLVIPFVGSNVDAARTVARVGADLSRAGRLLAAEVDPDSLHFVDGRVPLETVAQVTPLIDEASRVLEASREQLAGVDRAYLVGQVDEGVRKLRTNLEGTADDAARGAAAARIAPLVLGGDAPRRYLLVVQNPAELRGTGGLVGNWGILSAADGKVRLESLERVASLNQSGDPASRVLNAPADYVERYERFDPARSWQSVNISPDFPTVAAVMTDLYAQTFGSTVDGVLAVDPHGLAALLELTGPVQIDDWPTPIGAENVVDVTLRDAYAEFARTPERADFLGDVARAAIDRATTGDLGAPARLGEVLGRAAHEGHISLWFEAPDEQTVSDELDISGRVPAPVGDLVMVSNTNAGANKLDYYLQRGITYDAVVTPSGDLRRAVTQGTIDVELANTVPPEGVPQIAAGPYEGATDRFVYGQNHSFLSVYTPLGLQSARADGEPVLLETGLELDRNVYSRVVDVFSQSGAKVEFDVTGTVRLADGGWYELTLVRQPTLRPDEVTVRIAVPEGFEIRAARGLEVVDGVAEATMGLTRTRTVRVQIGHSGGRNLWERLQDGP